MWCTNSYKMSQIWHDSPADGRENDLNNDRGPDMIGFGMPLRHSKLRNWRRKYQKFLADAGVGFAERKAAFMANPCGQQSFIKVHTAAPPYLFIEGLFLFSVWLALCSWETDVSLHAASQQSGLQMMLLLSCRMWVED